jgi:hypothetical protein
MSDKPTWELASGAYKSIAEALWNEYSHYRLRTCYSLHSCNVCEEDIRMGQRYFDGGFRKRAHEHCVERRSYPQSQAVPPDGIERRGAL